MSKFLIALAAFALVACASSSTLSFRIKVVHKDDVDPLTARKIAAAWVLKSHNQGGSWVVQVFKQSANYLIITFDNRDNATEWFDVIEKCEGKDCSYEFSPNNEGLVE